MHRVPVYILAGGRSSRFGSDKARAIFRGQPLIDHVCSLVNDVACSITVVADVAEKYEDLGLRTIADLETDRGPAGGLSAALTDMQTEQNPSPWLLLCTCDVVVMETAWLKLLIDKAMESTGLADAIVFHGDRWQPMPGLYAVTALPKLSELLATDHRSMQRLLGELRSLSLPLPSNWPAHWQINSPTDLARLE